MGVGKEEGRERKVGERKEVGGGREESMGKGEGEIGGKGRERRGRGEEGERREGGGWREEGRGRGERRRMQRVGAERILRSCTRACILDSRDRRRDGYVVMVMFVPATHPASSLVRRCVVLQRGAVGPQGYCKCHSHHLFVGENSFVPLLVLCAIAQGSHHMSAQVGRGHYRTAGVGGTLACGPPAGRDSGSVGGWIH